MADEFNFIRWLKQRPAQARMMVGIGDDLAALPWNAADSLLVGVDQVLDGVHFDPAVHSPHDIGVKAMNRNLSDCAAMACLPAAAVCALALPAGCGEDYARQLYVGMESAAAKFHCPIVGGDTGSWPGKLVVTVTILGRSAGIDPITRSGARPGHHLYVTGSLGGSILGRHLRFEPRVVLARELAATGHVSAMCDLSDGLSRDLANLCDASGTGALLDAARIPIHADVRRLPASALTPLEHALQDGEDYELLLTSPVPINHPTLFHIGRITEGSELKIVCDDAIVALQPKGWQHRL